MSAMDEAHGTEQGTRNGTLGLIALVVNELRDRESWSRLSAAKLLRFLHHGLWAYSATNDESLMPLVAPVYAHATHITHGAARLEMYSAIKRHVDEGFVSNNVFVPFILFETDSAIVATATLDALTMSTSTLDDPLVGAKVILAHLREGRAQNPGAVFGGSVAVGDRDLNRLLNDYKWKLSDPDVAIAAMCEAGLPNLVAFEFWLDWCEELMGKGLKKTPTYRSCASALTRFGKNAYISSLGDLEPPLPGEG